MSRIYIVNYNLVVEVNHGLSLLNNFLINHSPIHTVCGGHAMCGCCRIKILSGTYGISQVTPGEMMRLGEDLIAQGWRLSCQTFTLRDIDVHMPFPSQLDDICS